ncbi:BTB/POZ domain-containing protein 3-like [Bradysia coprophila]|uniref:BTB/POZ domain-containing protein 3-like n=1 Tax=Bradysia coprophila TaxID=38358 RepID=UPI00187DB193|nr:BTB/POZ domain-containing protein 3-like [Bradysia coprophila]
MSINQHHANETEILSKVGRNLYLNAEKADVHFIFESEDERVPAQKNILSSGSDVFDTMFYGPLKEEGDIKIVDATAEAFKEFLRFFYFNKVDVSMEHVPDVMYLGRKYNVADCQRLCVNLLAANIIEQNAAFVLGLAIIYDEKQLQKSCELIIASLTDEVFKSENFLVCDRRVLEHILKMDRLACTEAELFEACMSWVRATSNEDHLTRDIVQTHLGRLFYEIRFGALTLKEFGELLPVYGELFSANEYSEILRLFSGQEMKPKIFQMEQRSPNWDRTKLIVYDHGAKFAARNKLKSESVTQFSSNTRLLLRYFVVDLVITEMKIVRKIENVKVAVIADSTEITQFTCTLQYLGWDCKVDLPSPISIMSENIYEIWITFPTRFQQPFTYRYSNSAEQFENNVVLSFHNYEHDCNGSSIKSLGFNLMHC